MTGRTLQLPEGRDVVLFWIQSERDTPAQAEVYERQVVGRCRAAASAYRMDLRLVTVDEIVVAQRDSGARVWVSGELVAPATAFFHTKLVSWPAYRSDMLRHLTTYGVLEGAGFCVTVPPLHNIVSNDKLVSLLASQQPGIRTLPTVRLCTREVAAHPLVLDDWSLDFPVIVKPASWGSGMGVLVARSKPELASVLQLAGAAELTLVIQPWLGPGTVDWRVYCVQGEPYTAMTRCAAPGRAAANVRLGGQAEITAPPPPLAALARRVAASVGLPYVCVDFLAAGGDFWFSEIEVDGGTATGGAKLTEVRFGAYRQLFDSFVAAGPVKRWRYA